MEREANYMTVGAFVLLVIGMIVWFVTWYTERQDKREYQRYEIYFQGSVSGLSQGSPVRYLGVDVGRVVRMRIDPRAADRVQVIVDIDAAAPISDQTLASLSLQGVTGLLYIDLERARGDKPVMARVPSEHYPVIRTVQSNFDILLSSLPELMAQGGDLASRLALLLNDENRANVTQTLKNLQAASSELPALTRDVRRLVTKLDSTVDEIHAAAGGVHEITAGAGPDLQAALARARVVMDNLASTTTRLDKLMTENSDNITRFSDQGLTELQALIRDSRDAAQEFRELSRSLKRDPSQLIYEQKYPGVEISR